MANSNVRLIIDNNYEIVEVKVSEEDIKYLLKLRDGYNTMLEVREINTQTEIRTLYARLLQPESILLVEIACRIELAKLMPTKEELITKRSNKFSEVIRNSWSVIRWILYHRLVGGFSYSSF